MLKARAEPEEKLLIHFHSGLSAAKPQASRTVRHLRKNVFILFLRPFEAHVINLENSLPAAYSKEEQNQGMRGTNFSKQINYGKINETEARATRHRVLLPAD